MSSPAPQGPRPVIPQNTRRDTILAVICGLLVLGFISYGVMTMGSRQEAAATNMLSGKVIGKKFTPRPEEEISFGSKGVKAWKTKGEYVLEVRVEREKRTFEVPVDANTYEAARLGDRQTFLRPGSEQKKVE